MDVIIVCHTEYGYVNNRNTVIFDKGHKEGVTAGVPFLADIAKKYEAKITFAVMPEVVQDFPRDTGQETGLHIHPGWEISRYGGKEHIVGDKYLRDHCKQTKDSSALRDYSYEEQLNIIKTGKEYLSKELKIEPKVFVSGRWSENYDTVKALIELGFSHDCSPVPGKRTDHFDWSGLPRICMPYNPKENDYQGRGSVPILITPVSRMWLRGIVSPESEPITGISWLKACFLEYYSLGLPLFHVCLHSPSMTSPYLCKIMDSFLAFIKNYNIEFKHASEIKNHGPISSRGDILKYLPNVNTKLLTYILRK